jgi:hypothetical protein
MEQEDYQEYLDSVLGFRVQTRGWKLPDVRVQKVVKDGNIKVVYLPTQRMLEMFNVKRR